MLYAGPARDEKEINLAIALAGGVFASPADDTGQNLERKHVHVLEHPGAGRIRRLSYPLVAKVLLVRLS